MSAVYHSRRGILTSVTRVDSDEPVQPPFKLRNFKLCSISSLTVIEYSGDKQSLSESLLVAHTTLLEISWVGSFVNSLDQDQDLQNVFDTLIGPL